MKRTPRSIVKTASVLVAVMCVVFANASSMFAQNGDAIVGKWYTDNDKSLVEVWKAGNVYHGKILWLKDSLRAGKPKLDINNSTESVRNNPVVGLQILHNLKFNTNEWSEGSIYDPESGKEYSCKATMNGANLELRGYILGMPFLGRTTVWTRNRKS